MDITLKIGNMAKPQSFTMYPYDGGETIDLQSEKRWITANLRTGEGLINRKNESHPTSYHLAPVLNPIKITLPENIIKDIQVYLLKNGGKNREIKHGGVTILTYENKELFSK